VVRGARWKQSLCCPGDSFQRQSDYHRPPSRDRLLLPALEVPHHASRTLLNSHVSLLADLLAKHAATKKAQQVEAYSTRARFHLLKGWSGCEAKMESN
jgi:hypothetical protein